MATFKDLNLPANLLAILEGLGFVEPTDIQDKAIPLLLSTKKIDFHGQAQTGTGKTLAFGIPLLAKVDATSKNPQALIVAPTRELAIQIQESLSKVGSKMGISIGLIYGGVSMEEQIRSLKKGVQIIVGTPGRLNDHIRKKTLVTSSIETLVLDEADIMLDMGFKDDIEEILRALPKDRQIWLFSATVKSGIADLIRKHMRETVSVRVTPKMVTAGRTKQYYCIVPFRSRIHAITRFIQATSDFYGFIFCQTKALAADVAEDLVKRGYNVAAIHGDLSQAQRNTVIKRFRERKYTILVATDVAARGIDIPDITHVINYSIPDDLESYVHRIGRTGRAGKEGIAITLVSKADQRTIQQIERRFSVQIEPIDVPSKEAVIEKRVAEIPAYILTAEDLAVPYAQSIEQAIRNSSSDDLKKIATKLLYDKFLSTLDLEDIPFTHVESAPAADQYQEIYLNVGEEDGVTREAVMNYLLQTPVIQQSQIMTIRIIKKRTYIKLSSDCSPNLVSSLRGKQLDGRKVQVNVTCLIGPERGRFGRGGGRGGYSGGGGRRRY